MRPVLGGLLPVLIVLAGCAHRDTLALLEHEGDPAGDAGAVAVLDPRTEAEIGLVDRANSRARLARGRVDARTAKKSLDPRYADLLRAIPPPPRKFVLYFVNDGVDLEPESQQELPKLFAEIAGRPGADVMIVAYTDAAGSDAYNQKLSDDRAESTAKQLEAQGLDVDIVEAVGRGESDPIAPNGPDGHQRLNRRVEVIVR